MLITNYISQCFGMTSGANTTSTKRMQNGCRKQTIFNLKQAELIISVREVKEFVTLKKKMLRLKGLGKE